MPKSATYQAVVIGVSAGGIAALDTILPVLPETFPLAVVIVQHVAGGGGNYLVHHFRNRCRLPVEEVADKEPVQPGTIYFAPANYHLLIECRKTLALSVEAKVNHSRPSIDVLFETAAEAYCEHLVGIILTGANSDGAAGLAKVAKMGGLALVQSPATAEVDIMPKAAIAAARVDHILPLREIGPFLRDLAGRTGEEYKAEGSLLKNYGESENTDS